MPCAGSATGGGHSERANYTDAVRGRRSIPSGRKCVNGIGDIAKRSDFLDPRFVDQSCLIVPKSAQKTEKELDAQFAKVHASIFGALLKAARARPQAAAQRSRKWTSTCRDWPISPTGSSPWRRPWDGRKAPSSGALNRNETQSHEIAIASSSVAQEVRKFIKQKEEYDGGWDKLLKELNEFAGAKTKRHEGWPKNERALIRPSSANELADLRGAGLRCRVPRHRTAETGYVEVSVCTATTAGDW